MFDKKRDLFYLYINPARNEPLRGKERVVALRDIVLSVFKDVVRCVSRLRRKKKKAADLLGKIVIFADSYNNYEALKFLLPKYPEAKLLCSGGYVEKKPGAISIRSFLSSATRFDKYLFLIYLSFQSRFRLRHYDLIIKSYDFVNSFVHLFQNNQPSAIFISNDHYPVSRALMIAAQRFGIRCFYIQHASVSEVFPPLRSSHALLYGKYSEDIYNNIKGSDGICIPVGNHRFDPYKREIRDKVSSGKIGVAFNTLDPIDKVLAFCDFLSKYFRSEDIVVRAHPAEKRKFDARFSVSPSREESSIDYLKKLDVVIAGNSSILLEAAAMNVYPFQIYFEPVPDYFIDYYGFIRNGVAEEVTDWEALAKRIQQIIAQNKFDARKRTKLYDASVGESFEYNVEEHIVSVAEDILNGKFEGDRKRNRSVVN